MRQIASRAFNKYVRAMLGLGVKDTQCSAKALRAEALPGILKLIDATGFAFDVDLIMSARQAGLTIIEVPVFWAHRKGSTVSLHRAAPAMVREVRRLRRKYQLLSVVFSSGLEAARAGTTPTAPGVINLTELPVTETSTPLRQPP